MQRNIDRLFKESAPAAAETRLLDAVMKAVAREGRRALLFKRLPLLASGLALSAGAVAYGVMLTIDAAARTGFGSFLSVLVTDTGTVLASWQDYLYTLLEALPVVPLAGVCAALFVFFLLLRKLDSAITRSHHLHLI